MNYFDHNDRKNQDARVRVDINKRERAKALLPFEGTLFMSKYEVQARCRESAYIGTGVRT